MMPRTPIGILGMRTRQTDPEQVFVFNYNIYVSINSFIRRNKIQSKLYITILKGVIESCR